MTDRMVLAGRVRLVGLIGRYFVMRGKLLMLRMCGRIPSMLRVMRGLLRHRRMAVTAIRLHGNYPGQCIAAE